MATNTILGPSPSLKNHDKKKIPIPSKHACKYSIKNRCSKKNKTSLKNCESDLTATVKIGKLKYEQSPVTENCSKLNSQFNSGSSQKFKGEGKHSC
jgi:hypothetical protein